MEQTGDTASLAGEEVGCIATALMKGGVRESSAEPQMVLGGEQEFMQGSATLEVVRGGVTVTCVCTILGDRLALEAPPRAYAEEA